LGVWITSLQDAIDVVWVKMCSLSFAFPHAPQQELQQDPKVPFEPLLRCWILQKIDIYIEDIS
jgi:hypothetical protein